MRLAVATRTVPASPTIVPAPSLYDFGNVPSITSIPAVEDSGKNAQSAST